MTHLKFILTLLLCFIAFYTTAQPDPTDYKLALIYNKDYERHGKCSDLLLGVSHIKLAFKDQKLRVQPNTWYTGGNLYFNAAFTLDKECAKKFDNALDKTYEYYLKALKLSIDHEEARNLNTEEDKDLIKLINLLKTSNIPYKEYRKDIMRYKLPYIARGLINKAVEEFYNGHYSNAKNYSLKSISANVLLGKVDSIGIYNTALFSERLEQYDEALEYYNSLIQINFRGALPYLSIANIYKERGNSLKEISIIREGLKAFPNDSNLIEKEHNYLVANGLADTDLAELDKAVKDDPNSSTLYYYRALKNDLQGNTKQAIADYTKAIELYNRSFDAAYRLGSIYYNIGLRWNNIVSNPDVNENLKHKASGKAEQFFSKAETTLELAHNIYPKDKSTMIILAKIYAIKGFDKKHTKMKTQLQEK